MMAVFYTGSVTVFNLSISGILKVKGKSHSAITIIPKYSYTQDCEWKYAVYSG